MASIKIYCPSCKKLFKAKADYKVGSRNVTMGTCGHFIDVEILSKESRDFSKLESFTGDKLFPFQVLGAELIANANGRALIADEMGLGKTVQALSFINLYRETSLPALYIVKSKLKKQWLRQHLAWVGEKSFCQIIDKKNEDFMPGFDAYIISYDLLWRYGRERLLKNINEIGIKTVVLDECQQIQNLYSKRTQEVMEVCGRVPQVIGLSGTPFKNRIAEYFPILNIINPDKFPTIGEFIQNWTESFWDQATGKYVSGGLHNPERFVQETCHFIIRRERQEVMAELPEIFRQFSYHDLSAEVTKAYEKFMEKFLEEMDSGGPDKEINLIAYMSKMRHLTGLSKIDPCIDAVMEILGSTERKVCIFAHHQDVEYLLESRLNSLLSELGIENCLSICQKNSDDTDRIKQEFIGNPKKRVLIASQLASGEGLDGLQRIDAKCMMLERQWNPANEEQVEGRFSRIGSVRSEVDALYFVAIGTIDEFFSQIIERKRAIIKSAMTGKEITETWDEKGILKELAEKLASEGRKSFKI